MHTKRLIWIGLGLLALALGALFRAFPLLAETLYGKGIYPVIRGIVGFTLTWLPLPVISVVAVLSLWWLWKTALVPVRRRSWTMRSLLMGVLSTAGALVFLFQFLWGFNYARPAWDQRLDIVIEGMTARQLAGEFERTTALLADAAAELQDVHALAGRSNRDHETSVRTVLRSVLEEHGFPLSSSPRVRIVRPKGILMRWNTAGIYVPYSGEGHVDAGLLPVQIPFTLAHEMAHGFGVADEGDCNFLAYLACLRSDDAYVRFAGVLSYWRYVAGAYRFTFPEEYETLYDQLPELVKTLLADIRTNNAKYPDFFPKLRNVVYDTYLKSQGVSDGLQSYGRVVQLVWRYEQRKMEQME